MFSHNTRSEDVLMYIDKIKENLDGIHLIGWMTHKTQKIKKIIVGGVEVHTLFYSRPDVKKFYPNLFSDNVGIEFTIKKEDIYKTLSIILEDNTQVLDLCTLEKWYVKSSGFKKTQSNLVIVDNFYNDPDSIREFAIKNLSFKPSGYHKGQRASRFILDGTMERFEKLLGRKILNWNHGGYANGSFQFCTEADPIVYHVDTQMFAGIVFLTPNAPLRSGTSTYKSQITGATRFENDEIKGQKYADTFSANAASKFNFYDNSTLDIVDQVANVYNRLVLWDAKTIHAAEKYFGNSIEDSRFFHLFFFDVSND